MTYTRGLQQGGRDRFAREIQDDRAQLEAGRETRPVVDGHEPLQRPDSQGEVVPDHCWRHKPPLQVSVQQVRGSFPRYMGQSGQAVASSALLRPSLSGYAPNRLRTGCFVKFLDSQHMGGLPWSGD